MQISERKPENYNFDETIKSVFMDSATNGVLSQFKNRNNNNKTEEDEEKELTNISEKTDE